MMKRYFETPAALMRSDCMDCRVIGERSDGVLRTAMPGNDAMMHSAGRLLICALLALNWPANAQSPPVGQSTPPAAQSQPAPADKSAAPHNPPAPRHIV